MSGEAGRQLGWPHGERSSAPPQIELVLGLRPLPTIADVFSIYEMFIMKNFIYKNIVLPLPPNLRSYTCS